MKSLKEFINEELQNSNTTVVQENSEQVSENLNTELQKTEMPVSENVENQETDENK